MTALPFRVDHATRADEADLMDRGLLLPKGTGGSPVNGHDAFAKGSAVRGNARFYKLLGD